MSFDTTSSNSGIYNGACKLLEDKMEHKLLYLACRHHIHEIIVADVFEACFGVTRDPDVLLFKRFKENWSNIDTAKLESGARFTFNTLTSLI